MTVTQLVKRVDVSAWLRQLSEEPERSAALSKTNNFQSITGKVVTGEVEGHKVARGNIKLLESLDIDAGKLSGRADLQRAEGQTVIFLAIDGKAASLVGVADPIKTSIPEAIRNLHDEGMKTEHPEKPLLCLHLQRPWGAGCRRSFVSGLRSPAFTDDRRSNDEL